jgi:hypothetical protein
MDLEVSVLFWLVIFSVYNIWSRDDSIILLIDVIFVERCPIIVIYINNLRTPSLLTMYIYRGICDDRYNHALSL